MTIYDAAMVGVVVAGMVWGALRGITWQVAGIASLVLGYAVAFPLSAELAPRFPGEPVVARGLAMLTVYLAVSVGVYATAWLIRATLRKLRFEAYDRHLGMVLGGTQGALLGIVATVFIVCLAPGAREPILTSPSGRVMNRVLDTVQPALPDELRSVLTPFWDGEADSSDRPRLADLDAPGASGLDEIPTDSNSALDWLQRRLPGADRNSAARGGSNEPSYDPSLLRSAMELGVEQVRSRVSGGEPGQPAPGPEAQAPRQSYWWEEDNDGRNTRRR